MNRQRMAGGARPQVVLIIDTERLISVHAQDIRLTPFNTGNARRKAVRRGARTFVELGRWFATRWADEAEPGQPVRPPNHRPVEITVDYCVRDVMRHVVDVRPLNPAEVLCV